MKQHLINAGFTLLVFFSVGGMSRVVYHCFAGGFDDMDKLLVVFAFVAWNLILYKWKV